MFYDHDLNQLPYYDEIIWDNGCFGNDGVYSQLVYFLKQKFSEDKKICIIRHVSKVFDVLERINSSDMDCVVINASDHPLSFNDFAVLKKPYIYLDYDFNKENYHAWHLLWSHWLSLQDHEIDFISNRAYEISCLYVKSRITRVFNITELYDRVYFDKIYTTWCDKFASPTEMMHEDGLIAADVQEKWLTYLEIEKSIPNVQLSSELESCQILGKGYEDTYLNIVLEARVADFGFLTEKIYKPIRAGQLFLTQSSPGTIRYLRSIGFDVYDDYIDHDRYDLEPDWKKRTRLMHSVLDEIQPRLGEIFNSTVERRKRNCEWLKDTRLIDRLLLNIK